jgi:hypothetical protein
MLQKLKSMIVPMVLIGAGMSLFYVAKRVDARTKIDMQLRMEVICPSFLSITRSARDTLIVMRNEPLCNRYVLDNLQ